MQVDADRSFSGPTVTRIDEDTIDVDRLKAIWTEVEQQSLVA